MDDASFLTHVAQLAKQSQEPVPCACILVDSQGSIVAEAYNTQRSDNQTASHAEMKAIAVANKMYGRSLRGMTAYGNCEPCTMCLSALIFAKIDRIVFSHRLNDVVDAEHQIHIDCFDFVKQFPYTPKLELITN